MNGRQLVPLRSALVVTIDGPQYILAEEISPENVGLKAYGLCSLPSEWVPPFFLISASCLDNTLPIESLEGWVLDCLNRIGLHARRQVMIRSSGVSETIENRGQLLSKQCSTDKIFTNIRDLLKQLSYITTSRVHLIIQEHIDCRLKGQLSNERRVKLEKRDWVVEVEPRGGKVGYTVPVAVRQWRDGKDNRA